MSLLLPLSYCTAGCYAGDTLTSSDPTPSLSAKAKRPRGEELYLIDFITSRGWLGAGHVTGDR